MGPISKIKALFGDKPPVSKPAAKMVVPKSAAKPAGKPAAKPAAKASVPSVVPAVHMCAEYKAKLGTKGCVVLASFHDAIFEGTVDPRTGQPLEGRALLKTGTVLGGFWSNGLFVKGKVVLTIGTTPQEQIGDWVPTTAAEANMNDGIGSRLAKGTLRDHRNRAFFRGLFVVHKNKHTRLIAGERFLAPRDVSDDVAVELLPLSKIGYAAGVFDHVKNAPRAGLCTGDRSGGTRTVAAIFRMDGVKSRIQEGMMIGEAGFKAGVYDRFGAVQNGECATVEEGEKGTVSVGTWKQGDGTHMEHGIRLHVRIPASLLSIRNEKNIPTDTSIDIPARDTINMVEDGQFSVRSSKRLLLGRRSNSGGTIEEGLFSPLTGALVCGLAISKPGADGVIAVTFKPTRELYDPTTRIGTVHGSLMRQIGGFRRWAMPESFWTAPAASNPSVGLTEAEIRKIADEGPMISESECAILELAWYEGDATCVLSRGEVFFGGHIDEGSWSLRLSTPEAAEESSRPAYVTAEMLVPLTREDRMNEALRLRSEAAKAGNGAGDVLAACPVLCTSYGTWVDLPLARYAWLVHTVDMVSRITTFSRPNASCVMDAASAAAWVEGVGNPRFTEEDMEVLDAGVVSGRDECVSTSVGFVNPLTNLRRLLAAPASKSEEDEALETLELGASHLTREYVLQHPLAVHARVVVSSTTQGLARGNLADGAPPSQSRVHGGSLRYVSRQYVTLAEEFCSSAFKRRFIAMNLSKSASPAQVDPEVDAPPRAVSHQLSLSPVIQVPLPPDADCPSEYRHSWGFVLEFIHWVGLRHACVPLLQVQQRGCARGALDVLSTDVGPTAFVEAVEGILAGFEAAVGEVCDRVYPPHSPFVTTVVRASAAAWPEGLVCLFVGEQLSVVSAACEVSMWQVRRNMEPVRFPSSWAVSSRLCAPTATSTNEEGGPSVSLYQVDPGTLEYFDVHNCMYNMDFPSVWSIVKVERVQNDVLYERYVSKRRQIGRECRVLAQAGHQGCNEHRWLAHGTRGIDPMVIARNGFDHRYAEKGLFGRASYFAYDVLYSHGYRHETGVAKEAQMFLSMVTAGNVEMRDATDKEIKHPKQGYHSVDGPLSDRFRGLMVYDLDQAYPAYLVTYRHSA